MREDSWKELASRCHALIPDAVAQAIHKKPALLRVLCRFFKLHVKAVGQRPYALCWQFPADAMPKKPTPAAAEPPKLPEFKDTVQLIAHAREQAELLREKTAQWNPPPYPKLGRKKFSH